MSKVAKVSSITNTKVYQVLENFSKIELNRLRKFIASPYFNASEALLVLFDALSDLARDLKSGKRLAAPDQEHLWKLLEPRQPFDSVRMRKYLSDLNNLIEEYIIIQELDQDQLQKANLLTKGLNSRKISVLNSNAIKNAEFQYSKHPYKDIQYYWNLYQREMQFYSLNEFEVRRSEKSNIEEINKAIDIFYISAKLRWYCEVLIRGSFSNVSYNLVLIEEIKKICFSKAYMDEPVILVYFQIMLTLLEPDQTEHYFNLKVSLNKFAHFFEPSDQESFYISALNYCIRKINSGHESFYKESLDLYKELLVNKVILPDGTLSPWIFKNIVTQALNCNELIWVEQFIEEYGPFIPIEYRENAIIYNKAALYFYQRKFRDVITLLQSVEYEDLKYAIDSRWFLLRTYYEIGETEALLSLCDSFRIFLQRKKDIPEQRRKSYLLLVNYTKRLANILPGDAKAIKALVTIIEAEKSLPGKKWLLDKLAALE